MSDCEPLRGKIKERFEYGEHTNHEYLTVDTFDKEDVASAVEFYKKQLYQWIKNKYSDRYAICWKSVHKELCKKIDYCFGDAIK